MIDDISKLIVTIMIAGGGLLFLIQRLFYNKDKTETKIENALKEQKELIEKRENNAQARWEKTMEALTQQKEQIKNIEKEIDGLKRDYKEVDKIKSQIIQLNADVTIMKDRIVDLTHLLESYDK